MLFESIYNLPILPLLSLYHLSFKQINQDISIIIIIKNKPEKMGVEHSSGSQTLCYINADH